MLKRFKETLKKNLFKARSFLIAKLGKNLLHLLIKTCRIQIEGIENFCQLAAKEKCMIMLWHNRLAIAPFILSKYTAHIQYAALVSGSRDGDILSYIVRAYSNGHTIRVPHSARYQALREIVRHVEEQKKIVIITPDGPRGPKYEIKPGIALAALETKAHVVTFNWEAQSYWELKTWDRLRLPKPFTTIRVCFQPSIQIHDISLEEAAQILKNALPQDTLSLISGVDGKEPD